MVISIKKSDFALWGWWVLAAILGRAVYYFIENSFDLPVLIAAGLISGLTRALPQWAVLANRLRRADLWATATFLGVSANAVLIFYAQDRIQTAYVSIDGGSMLSFFVFFPLLHAAQNALIGFFQWVALRNEVHRAGHWVWGAALGGAVSSLVNLALLTLILRVAQGQNVAGWLEPAIALITTAVRTSITGAFLVWLLHRPKEAPDAEIPPEPIEESVV